VLVDRDAVLDLVDQLRVAIPEEVRAAKRINSEGERILEKANEEADKIVNRAREQATYLIGERGLTELAEAESRRIVDEAHAAAADVRSGADEYARQMLEALEGEVSRALNGIQRGIEVLEQRQAELRGAPTVDAGAGDRDDEWYEDEEAGGQGPR
jgi:cell division septum initiation protein DivIVA